MEMKTFIILDKNQFPNKEHFQKQKPFDAMKSTNPVSGQVTTGTLNIQHPLTHPSTTAQSITT